MKNLLMELMKDVRMLFSFSINNTSVSELTIVSVTQNMTVAHFAYLSYEVTYVRIHNGDIFKLSRGFKYET